MNFPPEFRNSPENKKSEDPPIDNPRFPCYHYQSVFVPLGKGVLRGLCPPESRRLVQVRRSQASQLALERSRLNYSVGRGG